MDFNFGKIIAIFPEFGLSLKPGLEAEINKQIEVYLYHNI
jgi:hypothetical protein